MFQPQAQVSRSEKKNVSNDSERQEVPSRHRRVDTEASLSEITAELQDYVKND